MADKVYRPPMTANLAQFRHRITAAVQEVTPDLLQRVWQEIDYQWDTPCYCLKIVQCMKEVPVPVHTDQQLQIQNNVQYVAYLMKGLGQVDTDRQMVVLNDHLCFEYRCQMKMELVGTDRQMMIQNRIHCVGFWNEEELRIAHTDKQVEDLNKNSRFIYSTFHGFSTTIEAELAQQITRIYSIIPSLLYGSEI
ncbi:hypothetical protein C0J52_25111 [Blattella germanica]|nr:hypothetical protein C0J52_25111 [Blattella germanica]